MEKRCLEKESKKRVALKVYSFVKANKANKKRMRETAGTSKNYGCIR